MSWTNHDTLQDPEPSSIHVFFEAFLSLFVAMLPFAGATPLNDLNEFENYVHTLTSQSSIRRCP